MVTAVLNPPKTYPAGTLLAFLHYRSRGTKYVPKPDTSRGRFVKLVKAVVPKGGYPEPPPGCFLSEGIDPTYPKRLIIEGSRRWFVDAEKSIFQEASEDEKQKLLDERKAQALSGAVYPKVTGATGSDPEMFVLGSDGKVLPAYKFLPDKAQALAYPGPYGGHLFWDGFQAEFTTTQATCHAYHVDYIRRGMKALLAEAKKVDKGARLTTKCVVDVDEAMLSSAPPKGVALGCDPSLNAYNKDRPQALVECDPSQLMYRFAGCHLHFSYANKNDLEQRLRDGVKMADRLAGVVSVAMFRGMEDERRRKFYGLAGEYRRPSYGVEYRTLSTAMLCHPAICHIMLDLTRAGMGYGIMGYLHVWDGSDDEVQACINNLDIGLADRLVEKNAKFIESTIASINGNSKLAMQFIREGVMNLLPIDDVAANWQLDGHWSEHSNEDAATFARLRIKEKPCQPTSPPKDSPAAAA